METLAIVQARMSSTRFPGKVLEPILGKPMILRQLERVERASSLDGIVVATSLDASDDPLVAALGDANIQVHRGPLDDVLARFIEVINLHRPSVIVRLTADCPLTSPHVIDQVVAGFSDSGLDYRSNTLEPTFPDGLDVEVTKSSVLIQVAEESQDPAEREHVTLGIYRQPHRFQLANVASAHNHSDLRWTVDMPQDLEFARWVYGQLYDAEPAFEMVDVLALMASSPEYRRMASSGRRNVALDGLNTGAMKHSVVRGQDKNLG